MTVVGLLAALRMSMYAGMATYCLLHRRWCAWGVFTALIISTYVYSFSGVSDTVVEVIRTTVAVGLIYITLRRK